MDPRNWNYHVGFKRPGIKFIDCGDALEDGAMCFSAMSKLAESVCSKFGTGLKIGAMDGRGLLFAGYFAAVSKGRSPIVMFRKAGQLPGECIQESYDTEYSENNKMEVQKSRVRPGDRFVLVDDSRATSGTLKAATELVRRLGGEVVAWVVFFDLAGDAKEPFVFSAFKPDVGHAWTMYKTALKLQWDKRVVVLAHPTMDQMARDIALRSLQFVRSEVTWDRFEFGWPNVSFADGLCVNRDVLFVCSLLHPEHWIEINALLIAIIRQGIRSLTIAAPFFPTATNERVTKPGVVASAETTMQLFTASLPLTKRGPVRMIILDLHADLERFYARDPVVVEPRTVLGMFVREIFGANDGTRCICFPDEGSYKRVGNILAGLPMVVCQKVRDGDQRIVRIVDRKNFPTHPSCYDAPLREVWIVDDVVRTGGSINECRLALLRAGATKVSCFVTHAAFEDHVAWQFGANGPKAGLDRFVVTNSIPETTRMLDGLRPFEVLNIADLIADECLTIAGIDRLPSTKTDRWTVYVCSAATVKLKAVEMFLARRWRSDVPVDVMYSTHIKSDVSPQPVGLTEIQAGACNRYNSALKLVGGGPTWIVAIESGVARLDDGGLYEVTCAYVGNKQTTVSGVGLNDKLLIPDELLGTDVENIRKAGQTIGTWLQSQRGSDPQDWYHLVGNRSRAEVIASVLCELPITGDCFVY
eukprot:TRINITY_DN506_c0_g1_i2.p1 TRINITY_DN506_c0_g1~~TRINITY_DN506_c0_g1_i2.p1  ORF type:complete len:699 (-),score=62.01 TRINITY_DN506_c0_g1_i2:62-2158(-)